MHSCARILDYGSVIRYCKPHTTFEHLLGFVKVVCLANFLRLAEYISTLVWKEYSLKIRSLSVLKCLKTIGESKKVLFDVVVVVVYSAGRSKGNYVESSTA